MGTDTNTTAKFEISPAPIVVLYTWVFIVLCGLGALLLLLYNPAGWQSPAGLVMLAAWLFNMLVGVGVVSVFSYISGPEVYVEPARIRVHSSWLIDKAYLRRRDFYIAWSQVQSVRETRFYNMPYWVLEAQNGGEPVAVPMFLKDREGFLEAVKAASPEVFEMLWKAPASS